MGEFRCESLVPPEPLPWRAAAPAWRASLQNQPLTLSVPLYRPHLHEPIIFATLVPSRHFSSPALLQFRSLIPRANWPPEYSQPKTMEFSNYRCVPPDMQDTPYRLQESSSPMNGAIRWPFDSESSMRGDCVHGYSHGYSPVRVTTEEK